MTKKLLIRPRSYLAALGKNLRSSYSRTKVRIYPLIQRIKPRHLLFAGLFVLGLSFWLLTAGFFMPRSITLSFSEPTCVFAPSALPRLIQHEPSHTYKTNSVAAISIAGYPLFSYKTCISAQIAPIENSTETIKLAPLGNPLFKKYVSINTNDLPTVSARFDSSQAIGATIDLAFNLDQEDKLFSYKLKANGQETTCATAGFVLSCGLRPLQLGQGQTYTFALERYYDDSAAGTLFEQDLRILDPVVITSSSIAAGSVVYNSPADIVLVTTKKLVSSQEVSLVNMATGEQVSDVTTKITDEIVTILLANPLDRLVSYELRIGQLTAVDGSQLVDAYSLPFVTSGGPKVTKVSIGSTRVNPGANIVLSFDAGLKPGQDLGKYIRIESGGKVLAATLTHAGSLVTINPAGDLPRCGAFMVKVVAGLVNEFDIGGGEAWQLGSRALCQTTFSIGRSVQGRAITGYKFGDGASKIIFVGGMHGNEKSSVATMNAWIQYLEDHAHQIPAHRSIIVIPNHNPDGYAASRRTNANTVDLNRNFPSNDWSSSIQMPGGQNLPQGGGITPLDQPESSALASYILAQRPRLVLTYHAVARIVISNDAGDSIARSQQYARDSGYRFSSNANSGGTFEYATTGEFEDWLADRLGIAAILVELGTMSSNEINTHRSAMWNLVQLP